MENIVIQAEEMAKKWHSDTNHMYDHKYPYSYHLEMVVMAAKKFIHLIPEQHRENVIAACWLHDSIEDARITYNDVKIIFGLEIAELVYALTNEKGKTRSERANDKYYKGISDVPFAAFVKLCDRIANIEYGRKSGGSMLEKYRKENIHFINQLFDCAFKKTLGETRVKIVYPDNSKINKLNMKENKIYVVVSRDTGFLYCTTNLEKAQKERDKQEREEELSGGRPSVYIKETFLND